MMKLLKALAATLAAAAIMLTAADASAAGKEKLNGAAGVRFGWKMDKCIAAIGDVPRKFTERDLADGTQSRFSYAPASWGARTWDGSVLDFANDKLYQIGYYRATPTPDRSTVDAARSHLTDLFGSPVKVQNSADNLLFTAKNRNMALLQYVVGTDANGHATYTTYLMLIDNKQVEKKARKSESFLRSLVNGK